MLPAHAPSEFTAASGFTGRGKASRIASPVRMSPTPISSRLKTICSIVIQSGYRPGIAAITSVTTGKILLNSRNREYAQYQPSDARQAKYKRVAVIASTAFLDEFEARLDTFGYIPLPEYEEQRYLPSPSSVFEVRNGFPRLPIAAIPEGVKDVRYSIGLDVCARFATQLDWQNIGRDLA